MMDNREITIQRFLDRVHLIETHVARLIAKSNLSEQEKQYIMDHVLIVPGKSEGPES